jgi:hypothetical protein
LTTDREVLDDQRLEAFRSRIDPGCDTCGTTAHDENINLVGLVEFKIKAEKSRND